VTRIAGNADANDDDPLSRGQSPRAVARNAMNLMAGSGAQQTRTCRAEKAVEVVRNHGDGTRVGTGSAADPKEAVVPQGTRRRRESNARSV
jgi:hypothetical protein